MLRIHQTSGGIVSQPPGGYYPNQPKVAPPRPPRRKSPSKRNVILLAIAAFLVIGVIATAVNGSGKSAKPVAATASSAATVKASSSAASRASATSDATAAPPAPARTTHAAAPPAPTRSRHAAAPPPSARTTLRQRHRASPTTPAAAPPPPPASTAPASCHPLTNGGNCYEPGEFCRASDHGVSGVAGDGKAITCENNDGWRWEPAELHLDGEGQHYGVPSTGSSVPMSAPNASMARSMFFEAM